MRVIGSRIEVYNGEATRTAGGLRKADLMLNSKGKVVSKKASAAAKRANRLGLKQTTRPRKGGIIKQRTIGRAERIAAIERLFAKGAEDDLQAARLQRIQANTAAQRQAASEREADKLIRQLLLPPQQLLQEASQPNPAELRARQLDAFFARNIEKRRQEIEKARAASRAKLIIARDRVAIRLDQRIKELSVSHKRANKTKRPKLMRKIMRAKELLRGLYLGVVPTAEDIEVLHVGEGDPLRTVTKQTKRDLKLLAENAAALEEFAAEEGAKLKAGIEAAVENREARTETARRRLTQEQTRFLKTQIPKLRAKAAKPQGFAFGSA